MWLPLAKAPDFDTAILTRGQLPKDLDGQLLATINARLGSASANDMDLRRRMRNSLAADLLQGLSALDPSG